MYNKIFTARRKMNTIVMIFWIKILITTTINVINNKYTLFDVVLGIFQPLWCFGVHATAVIIIVISYRFMNEKFEKSCKNLLEYNNYREYINQNAKLHLKFMMILLISFIVIYLPFSVWQIFTMSFFIKTPDDISYFISYILEILYSFRIFVNLYIFHCTDEMYMASYKKILLYPINRWKTTWENDDTGI